MFPRELKNKDIQNWVQIYQSVQSGVGKLSCNIIIIIIIKDIYIEQVRESHKCAMSAEMAVWLRNCLCL